MKIGNSVDAYISIAFPYFPVTELGFHVETKLVKKQSEVIMPQVEKRLGIVSHGHFVHHLELLGCRIPNHVVFFGWLVSY